MFFLRWIYRHLGMVFSLTVFGLTIAYLYFVPSLKQETFTFELGDTLPTNSGYYFREWYQQDIDLSTDLTIDTMEVGRYAIAFHYGPYTFDTTIQIVDTTSPVVMCVRNYLEEFDDFESILRIEDASATQVVMDQVTDLADASIYDTQGWDHVLVDFHVEDIYGNQSAPLTQDVWLTHGQTMDISNGYYDPSMTLSQAIDAYVVDQGYTLDQLSYGYVNIKTGETITHDPATWRVAASTYKLPLNMLIFDQIDAGKLSLDSTIIFEMDDYELSAGYLTSDYELSDAIPISYLTYESLYYSSNTASRMLYKALGGFSAFKVLTDEYSDVDYASTGESNLINVDFLLDVLDYFYVHGDNYPLMYQWLSQAMPNNYGAMYINVPMVHKYGHYESTINDCGLIMAPVPFSYVVLTSDMSEIDIANIVAIMLEYTLFRD